MNYKYNNYGIYYPSYDSGVDFKILLGLLYWNFITKSNQRGIFFGLSVPFTKPIVLIADKLLDFFFSCAILFTYWRHPLTEISTLIIELIFIIHSCLIQTTFHKNKYWTMVVETTLIIIVFHAMGSHRPNDQFFGTLNFCVVVFMVTQMHDLNLTLPVKIVLITFCVLCTRLLCHHIQALANNDIYFMDTNDGMCLVPLFYYVVLLLAVAPFIFCYCLFTTARFVQHYISLFFMSALLL